MSAYIKIAEDQSYDVRRVVTQRMFDLGLLPDASMGSYRLDQFTRSQWHATVDWCVRLDISLVAVTPYNSGLAGNTITITVSNVEIIKLLSGTAIEPPTDQRQAEAVEIIKLRELSDDIRQRRGWMPRKTREALLSRIS